MEPQALTPEFLKYLASFYQPDGSAPHDKTSGLCKCGVTHTPNDLQMLAVREFNKTSGRPE